MAADSIVIDITIPPPEPIAVNLTDLGAQPATVIVTEAAAGDDGVPGASAYEVAVANGFVGSESDWLNSLIGPQGSPGNDGNDGSDATVNPASLSDAIISADSKTTPAETDEIPIIDSAASNALKRLTFSNLWVWITAKMDAGLSVAGTWAFTSTTRPTSAGTGILGTTDLVTLGDINARFARLETYLARTTADGAIVTNSTTAANAGLALTLQVGTYLLEMQIIAYSVTTNNGGWKFRLNSSGGTVSGQIRYQIGSGAASMANAVNTLNLDIGTNTATPVYVGMVNCIVVITGSTTTLTAQHALSFTDAAVPGRGIRAGSYFKATRLV